MSDVFVPNKDYLVEVNNLKQYFPIKAGMGKNYSFKSGRWRIFRNQTGRDFGIGRRVRLWKTT